MRVESNGETALYERKNSFRSATWQSPKTQAPYEISSDWLQEPEAFTCVKSRSYLIILFFLGRCI
jgi:hypothetical protein